MKYISSKEIAKLTGKSHADVLLDIEGMAGDVICSDRGDGCYHLDKEASIRLVLFYSLKGRMAVLRRWADIRGHTAIVSWSIANRFRLSSAQASAVDRCCARYCRNEGIEIKNYSCPRYGDVTLYPEHIIARVVEELRWKD